MGRYHLFEVDTGHDIDIFVQSVCIRIFSIDLSVKLRYYLPVHRYIVGL